MDPWKLPPDTPPADFILVTHAHYDHCSPDDVARIRTPRTLLVCPADAARTLGGTATIVAPGQSVAVGPWTIETVPAGNLRKEFHPLSKGWVGYVLTLDDRRRLFHAGDTDQLPAHDGLRVDIALLPCGGTYTMDGEEAGRLAEDLAPGVAIPMHWGDIVGSHDDAMAVQRHYPPTVILEPMR